MRFKPVRWDGSIILLCYFCAFWLLASPLIPYEFNEVELYVGTVALGTALAAVGVWLNHKAESEQATKQPDRRS
jgi:hypothetical protein